MNKFILLFFAIVFLPGVNGLAQSTGPGDNQGRTNDNDAKKERAKRPAHTGPAKPSGRPRTTNPTNRKFEGKPVSPGFSSPTNGRRVSPNQTLERRRGNTSSTGDQNQPRKNPPIGNFGKGRVEPSGPAKPMNPIIQRRVSPNSGFQAPSHTGLFKSRPSMVPDKFRRMGITRMPQPISDWKHLPDARRERSTLLLPDRDGTGRIFKASPMPRQQMGNSEIRHHMYFAHDADFNAQVNRANSVERNVNHYYWHSWKNQSYCHYYDRWGAHWYGWTMGSKFFWTRYNADRWWWYDLDFARWCYWDDGRWWWQDPYHVNVVYVYVDGRYESAGLGNSALPAVAPSSMKTFYSPDRTRMIKVMGEGTDAFLYDVAEPPAFNPVYLASEVKDVKFSSPGEGKPLQVLLVLKDDSFSLFDYRGNPSTGTGLSETSP